VSNFANLAAPGAVATTAVPEPVSRMYIVAMLALFLRRRMVMSQVRPFYRMCRHSTIVTQAASPKNFNVKRYVVGHSDTRLYIRSDSRRLFR
jgi:hypothetical protein